MNKQATEKIGRALLEAGAGVLFAVAVIYAMAWILFPEAR